jgi:hypothetical protein
MKRLFERTAIIIIALIFSICFTGQHLSHGKAKISVNVNVVMTSFTGFDQDEPDDPLNDFLRMAGAPPTEEETLVQSYIEWGLSNSDYVFFIDDRDSADDVSLIDDRDSADFTVILFVVNPKHSSVDSGGFRRAMPAGHATALSLFYVLTRRHEDCPRGYIESGYCSGYRSELREMCHLITSRLDDALQKYKL